MSRYGNSHPDWLFGDSPNLNCPANKLLVGFVKRNIRLNVCVMIETESQDGGSSLGSLFRHNARVWGTLSLGDQDAMRETLHRIILLGRE